MIFTKPSREKSSGESTLFDASVGGETTEEIGFGALLKDPPTSAR